MNKLFGPISRIAIGLVSITIGLLLVVSFFGVLRDDVEMARQARTLAAEDLSIQLAVLLQKDDNEALKRTIDAISGRDGEILSVAMDLDRDGETRRLRTARAANALQLF